MAVQIKIQAVSIFNDNSSLDPLITDNHAETAYLDRVLPYVICLSVFHTYPYGH